MEVPYNYHILNVKLTNKGLGAVIRDSGLTTEQADRYDVLMTPYPESGKAAGRLRRATRRSGEK